jgi:hypothetical protein
MSFYWIKPFASSTVAVTCSLLTTAGAPFVTLTATADYTLKEPSPFAAASYGTIAADNTYHRVPCGAPDPDTWLHYGDPCLPQHGITWDYSVTADSDEAGTITMFQLWQRYFSTQQRGQGSAFCSDNQIPYDPAVSTAMHWRDDDSPAWDLTPLSPATAAYGSSNFQDYFMYKPADNSTGSSIWVALARLQWGWDASSSLVGGSWQPPTIYAQAAPAAASSYTDLPIWTCTSLNS